MNILLFVLLLALLTRLLLRTPIVDKFLPVYGYLTMTQDRLFRLLSVIKDAFEQYNIPYAITGTTLLGAVTLQNFFAKDRTIQLLVPSEHIQEIIGLTDQFYKSFGLGIQDLPDGCVRIGGAFALTFMDDSSVKIIPIHKVGDRWISQSRSLLNEMYDKDELFPTKLYPIGNLDVPGPRDPINYLTRNFAKSSQPAFREIRMPVTRRGNDFIVIDPIPTYGYARGLGRNTGRISDLRDGLRNGEVLQRFPRGSAVMAPIVGRVI